MAGAIPRGRTVTEIDNVLFSALTMNTQPLHLVEKFSKQTQFGQHTVHGPFTTALTVGMENLAGNTSHPKQVDMSQSIFTPSDEQIAYARQFIQVHDEQQAQGVGAFAFAGKMIDRPAIRAAQQVLARAHAAGKI